jgi:TolA-binding protein
LPTKSTTIRGSTDLKLLSILFAILMIATAAHAADEPATPHTILELLSKGSLDEADRRLSEFESRHGDSEELPNLYLASMRARQTPIAAIGMAGKIVERFPESAAAATAQFELAELNFISGNTTAATSEALRFCDRHPDDTRVPKAMLLLAAIDVQRGRTAGAADRYARVVARFPNTDFSAEALVGLGDCKFRLDDLPGAKEAYERAIKAKSPSLNVGKVYLQLGKIGQKRGRTGEARRDYMLLVRHYPESTYAKTARAALAAMGTPVLDKLHVGPPTLSAPVGGTVVFAVQAGIFPTKPEAELASQVFVKAGHNIQIQEINGSYAIRIGRFDHEPDAQLFAEELKAKFGIQTQVQQQR